MMAREISSPLAGKDSTGDASRGSIGKESIMIDVTKQNFLEQSNDFIKRLPSASWIAIDEEMSGIQLPHSMAKKLNKDDNPSDRYPSLKLVSERYAIIQLGITLFEHVKSETENPSNGPNKFNVVRYKFTLFPASEAREVVLSPGSLRFLAEENNCNLNEWIKDGIPYCTGDAATELLQKFRDKQMEKREKDEQGVKSPPPYNKRRKIELTRTEDKDFNARVMASLREWLDAAIVPNPGDLEGASFLLPPCNSFLRRVFYETIPVEYPNLVLETLHQTGQIRVWRLNAEERRLREKRLQREGFERLLTEKVGVWRVFLALSLTCSGKTPRTLTEHMALSSDVDEALKSFEPPSLGAQLRRKIPLVVHNGLHDLLFLFSHFHSPILPEDWKECKSLIHSFFPVIYDTKLMASEYCLRDGSRGRTTLGVLFEQTLANYPQWRRVFYMNGKEQTHEQLHDASYDSYCTGAAFCGLAATIHDQTKYPPPKEGDLGSTDMSPVKDFALWDCNPEDENIAWYFGRNKIHFHLSPFTIDLESPNLDPLAKGMSPLSTYRVAGIDAALTTRDIVRCLSGLFDASGSRVNFEIVWVDDTCFIVGAMLHSRDKVLIEEHGKILLTALRRRFQKEVIEPIPIQDAPKEPASSLWNLWGLLGSGKSASKRALDGTDEKPSKKRRIG